MNRRSFLGRIAAALSAPFVARALPAEPDTSTYDFSGIGYTFDPNAPVYIDSPSCVIQGRRMREELDDLVPCVHRFRDGMCGYAGPEARCDKRLKTCRRIGNERRFGGIPLQWNRTDFRPRPREV